MHSAIPSGIETENIAPQPEHSTSFSFEVGRYRLIQAELHDQTDVHAELLQEREWLLHSSESELRLQGNAFALENTIDGTGTVFLKLAPLPHERGTKSEWDVLVKNNGSFELGEEDGYQWRVKSYDGGKWGRIAALHQIQRELRPYNPRQDGLLLTNTWGDRNRDARIAAEFIAGEIEAAVRLGADVIQIDDGWQQGITANSVASHGSGVWGHYYEANPDFWEVNRERFPDGLVSLFQRACDLGLRLGLWWSPDASNEGAQWQRDAEVLLRLHRKWGVEFFKVDGLKIQSPQSERRLKQLFEAVRRESNGAICFDFDITAEHRFGYFGHVEAGLLFVENRYTDWHRYWPHHTLRVAWKLAHWVDPIRLRLEWLNNARHEEKYVGDPLAPSRYRPDAIFATTMFCSPLGWFEIQSLPENYFSEAAPLIAKWKSEREALHSGTILPVGEAPDGLVWTGFVSIAEDRLSGYALLFRELNEEANFQLRVPLLGKVGGAVEILGGEGTATLQNGVLAVQIPHKLRFIWIKFSV